MYRTRRARLIPLAGVPVLVAALLLESWAVFPLVAVVVLMPLVAVIDTACIWDQLDATPTGTARTRASSPKS